MKTNKNSICLSLLIAGGLGAATISCHAQKATATLSWVADGASYDYTITLHNTGAVALNGFWYGWTTDGDNLRSTPTNPGNGSGWNSTVSGRSIKWMNQSYVYAGYTYYYGTSLAAGGTATFTFTSSTSPTAITTAPSGESVAYEGGIDLSQGKAGDSTGVFSPSLATPPATVPTVTSTISGVAAASGYDYTITLQNTGSAALNSFWYGWTTAGNNLPSVPTTPANSLGWSNVVSGNSIKWTNGSGTALAAGASATFTFASSAAPSAITNAPAGESVAYEGAIDFSQNKAGDSTAVFSPSLVAPPPAVPTVTSTITGVADGASYNYTITLQNTGTAALNSFWYGWTTSGNNLPSVPTTPGNSVGWNNLVSGNSIKWINTTGTALAAGASATFTFVSADAPAAITASPSGESVAYEAGIDFSQDTAGDSTDVFSPTFVPGPPVLAMGVTPAGAGAGSSGAIVLSWPTNMPGLTLQTTTNLGSPGGWASNSVPPVVVNGQYTVTNPISASQQFFRLAAQ